ncbi:unnamed protein product [Agarophyton chilense]|eukprot:gb/GEZJ01001654.1/.p1 GENE.gb/GEZJ01001654.1/~~gb/GEZJ01001654.1/.p1  ORF type:complete len:958 (-),score=116.29 gb/GEZJ01001654.1/:3153-6026(-)
MVFGPFGVDAFALTEVLSVLKEITARLQAPRDIHDVASYMIARAQRIEPWMHDYNNPDVENSEKLVPAPLPSQVLLSQHKFLLPEHESRGQLSLLEHYIRIFLRREVYSDLLETAARYQSHEINDRILRTVYEVKDSIREMRKEHEASRHIQPCLNTKGALDLIRERHIRFHGLDSNHDQMSKPIHRVDTRLRTVPVWGTCPPSETLFGNEHDLSSRFHVLMKVAAAFTVAHQAGWYHGRLTPDMIRIVEPNVQRMTNVTTRADTASCVVVQHFFDSQSRIGCRVCEYCCSREKELESEANPPKEGFSFKHRPQSGLIALQPEAEDRYIFGNLVCWLYSGECFNYNDPNCSHNNELLQHVPWPLRMIVADAPDVEMHAIHLWLDQLHKKTIDPFVDRPLCSFPLRRGSVLSISPISITTIQQTDEAVKSKEEAILECSIRAATVAARGREPQAVLHLGLLLELRYRNLAQYFPQETEKAAEALRTAYDYYVFAAEMQNSSALVHIARLLCQAFYDRNSHCSIPLVPQSQILSLLIEGALRQNVGANRSLELVWKHGLQNAMEASFPDQTVGGSVLHRTADEDDSRMLEADLMNMLHQLGLQLRLGKNGIQKDERFAGGCLSIARHLGHLGSSLELGLFLVERGASLGDVRQGMDILQRLANWPLGGQKGSAESLEACYRLGLWCNYGLSHEFGGHNFQDKRKALIYIETAAKQDHKRAMVLYGMKLIGRNGREEDGKEWILKAGDCTSAFLANAKLEWGKAMTIWDSAKKEKNICNAQSKSFSSGASADSREKKEKKKADSRKVSFFNRWLANAGDGRSQSSISSDSMLDLSVHDNAVLKLACRRVSEGFQKAENMFYKCRQRRDILAEELCDPYYLCQSAEFYNAVKDIWGWCDAKVSASDLEEKAKTSLVQAIEITSSSSKRIEWKRWRRNWIREDENQIRRARRLLESLDAQHK